MTARILTRLREFLHRVLDFFGAASPERGQLPRGGDMFARWMRDFEVQNRAMMRRDRNGRLRP